MLEYVTLNFNGKSSSDFGIVCANGTGNGQFQDIFAANKTINEDTTTQQPIPYFKYVSKAPLDLPPINLFWTNGFNEEGLQLVKQWLNKDTYSEFYFEEYPIRHYFGMMYADDTLTHNGAGEGFATIKIRCNGPYAYSPMITDYREIPDEGKFIEINNKGDYKLCPYIKLTKTGDGDFSILNFADGGNQCIFTGLKDGETITVDGENEIIETDLPNTYRYDNHNDVFLKLKLGINRLFVNGTCKMKIFYRYIYM